MIQSKRATKRRTKASSQLSPASTYPSRHLLGRAHTQRSPVMDWIQQAKQLFHMPKPEHFTNYRHCCECAEHDATLLACDVDSISLQQLGNPGWDPLCFTTAEGLLYYLPALIRLTLDTMDTPHERYLDQLLFHVMYDGKDNRIVRACSPEQRALVAEFLAYLIEQYSAELDGCTYADDMLKVYDIWNVG
jgi:hypothetical protein